MEDDGVPSAKGSGIVRVEILNINDPPYIEAQTRYVGEHLPVGTAVDVPVIGTDGLSLSPLNSLLNFLELSLS